MEIDVKAKVKAKATNLHFTEAEMKDIQDTMKTLGFVTAASFIKFSCKQMCNIIKERGAIAFKE